MMIVDMNDKRGFSLIELMVVVVVGFVLIGGVSLGVNDFLTKEKVNQAANELVSSLNLARSLAVSNQSPEDFGGLDYVAVTIGSSGLIEAFPVNNNIGPTTAFFSKTLTSNSITVSPAIGFGELQFGAGNGKLVRKDASNYNIYPLPPGDTKAVIISSAETTLRKKISVSAYGIYVENIP